MAGLKSIIASVLSSSPSPQDVRELLGLCHRMAEIYLLKSIRSSTASRLLRELSLQDLAWDSIAELFARDERNKFIRLTAYFNACTWGSMTDAELEGAVRRLIFSQTHQAICRFYREADPVLAKLLRNLKIAVKASSQYSLARHRGKTWLCLHSESEDCTTQPVMPPEFLAAHLTACVRDHTDVKTVLQALAKILAEQDLYRKSYPLTGFALLIRAALVHLHNDSEDETPIPADMDPDDVRRLIQFTAAKIHARMRPAYVDKRKLDATTYCAYFAAIRAMLEAEYVALEGCQRSNYDFLRQHLPDLTQADYKRTHRCRIEYLAKLSRQELLDTLRKLW